jgi:hypothetical protein
LGKLSEGEKAATANRKELVGKHLSLEAWSEQLFAGPI